MGFAAPHSDRAHSYLSLRLQNCGDAQVEHAGAELASLRRLRNRADYDLRHPLSQNIAAAQVGYADPIIRSLDVARLQPIRTQITDAMRIYERDVLKDVTWQKP